MNNDILMEARKALAACFGCLTSYNTALQKALLSHFWATRPSPSPANSSAVESQVGLLLIGEQCFNVDTMALQPLGD